MIILVYGLPGCGKTTLAKKIIAHSKHHGCIDGDCDIFHADEIREKFNRGDLSINGKIKFAKLLKELADNSNKSHQIVDFVAPTKEMREVINADLNIWVNTKETSPYKKTNEIFDREKYGNVYEINSNEDDYMSDILQIIQGWRV